MEVQSTGQLHRRRSETVPNERRIRSPDRQSDEIMIDHQRCRPGVSQGNITVFHPRLLKCFSDIKLCRNPGLQERRPIQEVTLTCSRWYLFCRIVQKRMSIFNSERLSSSAMMSDSQFPIERFTFLQRRLLLLTRRPRRTTTCSPAACLTPPIPRCNRPGLSCASDFGAVS